MTKTKVLFLAANPIEDSILKLDEEIRAITQKIHESHYRNSLELVSAWAVRTDDLQDLFLRHQPHIVHFSGHGNEDGEIILVGKDGKPQPVDPEDLRDLLVILKDNIRVVVLNACYTEELATSITKVIDSAVGMNTTVHDDTARVFAAAFYRAIGFGRSVKTAFELGVNAVSMDDLPGETTPQLKIRDGLDAADIIPITDVHDETSPPLTSRGITYASAFLSHSWTDKALVELVAAELGRRGVIAWLDTRELQAGSDLSKVITTAVNEHAAVAAFLSTEAIKSGWVAYELKAALEKETELGANVVMPVYLEDPYILVQAHPILRNRWMHPETGRVDRMGVIADTGRQSSQTGQSATGLSDLSTRAKDIAAQLARAIYRKLKIEGSNEVIIYLDQRGDGPRLRKLDMPPDLLRLDAPALVFRTGLDSMSKGETLHGDKWREMRDTMKQALGEAVGSLRRPRKVHVAGDAQLGLLYLMGHHFDRTTNVELHCTGRDRKQVFSNEGWPRLSPLQGGNPHCETPHPRIRPLEQQPTRSTISLLLCKHDEGYIGDVLNYLAASENAPSPDWVEHDHKLTSSLEVMSYVANVVALLKRLHNERGVNTAYIFTTLPFHAIPLLAAELTQHVIDKVVFMEYRSDLRGTDPRPSDLYVPLEV